MPEQSEAIKRLDCFSFAATAPDGEPVAYLMLTESRVGTSRASLIEAEPEYGYRLIDLEGNVLGEIAPGYWPYFKDVMGQAIALHGEKCVLDSATPMVGVDVIQGEKR